MEYDMLEYIIRNAIQTPDGTILESLHRHDYHTHLDENGQIYMVDGGDSYIRRSINSTPAKELTVTSYDDFSVVRQHLKWGTCGENGDEPYSRKALCDMTTAHIQAIFDDGYSLHPFRKEAMNKELKLRGDL